MTCKGRVLVLGGSGMLGNAVGAHFINSGWDVTVSFRKSGQHVAYGPKRIEFDALSSSLDDLPTSFDYLINCIGIIKPFMAADPIAARLVNAVFPWKLADWCSKHGIKMIHITTDCVFSGAKGKYVESDLHDALDDYGKSKSLGEPVDRCMVLRTSIIGEEIHKNASLIAWAKNQKGKAVKGFTNHFWNGVTTKQYAKACDSIMSDGLWEKGLFHIFAPEAVSKYDMMAFFNEKFDLGLAIEPFEAKPACDRSMASIKPLCEKLRVPTVKEQVMSL